MTVLIVFYIHMFFMDMICNFNFMKGSAYGFDFMLPPPPPGLCAKWFMGHVVFIRGISPKFLKMREQS